VSITQETNGVIEGLIEALTDGELGFKVAAEDVSKATLKQFLLGLAAQRAQFARTLQSQVERLNDEFDDSDDTAGSAHRSWAQSGRGDLPDDPGLLGECEKSEESVLAVYRGALKGQSLGEARAMVADQFNKIRMARDQIAALRESKAPEV